MFVYLFFNINEKKGKKIKSFYYDYNKIIE